MLITELPVDILRQIIIIWITKMDGSWIIIRKFLNLNRNMRCLRIIRTFKREFYDSYDINKNGRFYGNYLGLYGNFMKSVKLKNFDVTECLCFNILRRRKYTLSCFVSTYGPIDGIETTCANVRYLFEDQYEVFEYDFLYNLEMHVTNKFNLRRKYWSHANVALLSIINILMTRIPQYLHPVYVMIMLLDEYVKSSNYEMEHNRFEKQMYYSILTFELPTINYLLREHSNKHYLNNEHYKDKLEQPIRNVVNVLMELYKCDGLTEQDKSMLDSIMINYHKIVLNKFYSEKKSSE